YELLKPLSTPGKPLLDGSSALPVFAIPAVTSAEALVTPSGNEFKKLERGLRMKRMLVPNCKLCLPLVQEMSSTKLCTGVCSVVLRTIAKLELLLVLLSFNPRK